MTARVAIIGAGIAGLGAALGLARRGVQVTVIERDPPPAVADSDAAFSQWDRRMVPQWHQPHGFLARARNLLSEWAPDVLERLAADGIETFNPVHLLLPPDEHRPDDDQFTGIFARRPAFELALRRVVEAEAGIEVMSPAMATGLTLDTMGDGPPRVTGVRVADGRELAARVVLDCGGRRSRVAGWLARAGVDVPYESYPCELTYYARHFRQRADSTLFPPALLGVRGDLGYMAFAAFPGDHRTYVLGLVAPPWDEDLKVFRHTWAWEAAAQSCERMAPWLDRAQADPISEVLVMGDQQNMRRRYVVDGRPRVVGILAVGDALCTTNPFYAWGASLALTHAFAAVDSMLRHPTDAVAAAIDFEATVGDEVDAAFRESVANDRIRTYRWRGEEVPPQHQNELERVDLIRLGIAAGAGKSGLLRRALLRHLNLIGPPGSVLDDPDVVAEAATVRDRIRSRPQRRFGPARDELLEILASACPQPGIPV